MDGITFGKKEAGIEYIRRPAVYGIFFSDEIDRIAIIQTGDGNCFLPGGGIENNEMHEACMKREALEEMGMDIEMGPFLGCAQRYFYSTNECIHYLSEAYFYLCTMGRQICEPSEQDHSLVWLESFRSADYLFHEHQAWAVKEALKLSQTFC